MAVKKTTSAKKTVKTVKKTVSSALAKPKAAKKASPAKPTVSIAAEVHGLSVNVVDVEGKTKGKMTLPAEVFGEKINKPLLAQAVRVYLSNQRAGSASTKTRGEVEGSTRKIYKQKGTGKARHGGIRAPIFVGGGIVFGPRPHSFAMSMPTNMKRKALASALSAQLKEGNVIVVDGFETLKPKTKFMAQSLSKISGKDSTLLVVTKDAEMVVRITRNIGHVDTIPATDLTTYGVLTHHKIVFMKDAVQAVKETIGKKV